MDANVGLSNMNSIRHQKNETSPILLPAAWSGGRPHNRPKSASVRLHVCPASVRGSGAHCMSRNSCAAHAQKDATNGFLDGGRHLALSRLGCHDAWRGSAEGASADHGWTRGHTGRREPFLASFLAWPKTPMRFCLVQGPFSGHFRAPFRTGRR